MANRNTINKYWLCGMLAAVAVYAAVMLWLQVPRFICYTTFQLEDAPSYIEAAKLLYLHRGTAHEIRPFGIAAIVGLPLLINKNFELWQYWMWAVQGAMWLSTVSMVYASVNTLTQNRKVALLAQLFFATCIGCIVLTTNVMSDSTAAFVMMMFFYCFVKFSATKKNYLLAIAAWAIACISIVRPGFYFLSIAFVIAISFFFLRKKNFAIAVVCLLAFVFPLAQKHAMQKQYEVNDVSTIGSRAVITYLCTRAQQYKSGLGYEEQRALLEPAYGNTQPKNLGNAARTVLLNQWQYNRNNLLASYAFNVYENCKGHAAIIHRLPSSEVSTQFQNSLPFVEFITRLQNLCISGVALFLLPWLCWFSWRKKNKYSVVYFTAWVIAYYTIFTSAISFWQNDRFHIVFYGIIITILAAALSNYKQAKTELRN